MKLIMESWRSFLKEQPDQVTTGVPGQTPDIDHDYEQWKNSLSPQLKKQWANLEAICAEDPSSGACNTISRKKNPKAQALHRQLNAEMSIAQKKEEIEKNRKLYQMYIKYVLGPSRRDLDGATRKVGKEEANRLYDMFNGRLEKWDGVHPWNRGGMFGKISTMSITSDRAIQARLAGSLMILEAADLIITGGEITLATTAAIKGLAIFLKKTGKKMTLTSAKKLFKIGRDDISKVMNYIKGVRAPHIKPDQLEILKTHLNPKISSPVDSEVLDILKIRTTTPDIPRLTGKNKIIKDLLGLKPDASAFCIPNISEHIHRKQRLRESTGRCFRFKSDSAGNIIYPKANPQIYGLTPSDVAGLPDLSSAAKSQALPEVSDLKRAQNFTAGVSNSKKPSGIYVDDGGRKFVKVKTKDGEEVVFYKTSSTSQLKVSWNPADNVHGSTQGTIDKIEKMPSDWLPVKKAEKVSDDPGDWVYGKYDKDHPKMAGTEPMYSGQVLQLGDAYGSSDWGNWISGELKKHAGPNWKNKLEDQDTQAIVKDIINNHKDKVSLDKNNSALRRKAVRVLPDGAKYPDMGSEFQEIAAELKNIDDAGALEKYFGKTITPDDRAEVIDKMSAARISTQMGHEVDIFNKWVSKRLDQSSFRTAAPAIPTAPSVKMRGTPISQKQPKLRNLGPQEHDIAAIRKAAGLPPLKESMAPKKKISIIIVNKKEV